MPVRVQLRRTKGWRMPEGCRKVDRSTRYGNPFHVWRSPSGVWGVRLSGGELLLPAADREAAAGAARHLHRLVVAIPGRPARLHVGGRVFAAPPYPPLDDIVRDLAGADLGCWCAIGSPCHGDTLLEVANR